MFPTRRLQALLSLLASCFVLAAGACGEGRKKTLDRESAGGAGGHGGEPSSAAGGAEAAAGALEADDSSYAGSATDGATCRPGLTRCHGDLGFQRCEPEGVWGESQSCGGYSDNGTSSYCAVVDSGDEPWAACVDPACWWWIESGLRGAAAVGVCVGSESYRPCNSDGILGRAAACEGACQVVGSLDGRELGYCDAVCTPGERECLAGSLYRECVGGRWATEPRVCGSGAECQPLATGRLADVACGGPCEPGTSRCSPDGAGVEACSEEGEWEAQGPCALGRCVRSGAQAQCQTECRPGERLCAFDGAASEMICTESGLWGEPEPCQAGAGCRLGTAGAAGCLPCVGGEVQGGNVWGVVDRRCEGDAVSSCGLDNEFQAAEPCSAGQSCVEVRRGASVLAYCE